MSSLEKIWVLICLALIIVILAFDPKAPMSGRWDTQDQTLFVSASEGQKLFKQLNWILVLAFFFFTLFLSYAT